MNKLCKFSLKYLFAGALTVVFLVILTWEGSAGYVQGRNFYSALTSYDTIKPGKGADTLGNPEEQLLTPSLVKKGAIHCPRFQKQIAFLPKTDTIPSGDSMVKTDTFSLKLSNDSLDAPVYYEAEDSAVVLIKDEKIIMYGKTKTDYKADYPYRSNGRNEPDNPDCYCNRYKRQSGRSIGKGNFKDGEQEFQSDTIKFNSKTQKGLTRNTFTQQGELFVNGEDIKKYDDNTIYIKRGIFTTCNLDEPHFGFRANKMKVINKKLAVSGPAHPEFEGVPIPVYLPFGFYPLSQGRHSGFLPPQFTTNDQFGIGLTKDWVIIKY